MQVARRALFVPMKVVQCRREIPAASITAKWEGVKQKATENKAAAIYERRGMVHRVLMDGVGCRRHGGMFRYGGQTVRPRAVIA